MTLAQEGHRLGRIELIGAAFLIFVAQPLMLVLQPGFMGGRSAPWLGPLTLEETVVLGAFAVQVAAFAWMIRLHRAHHEGAHRFWRYRARG